MDVNDHLKSLQKEASEKSAEVDRLTLLKGIYPDLQRHVNRWGAVRFYSKAVNTQVQRFDMKHNCGCCSDSPLEVWPYLQTEHGNVYSDPPVFTVGEQHWIAGDTPYEGWQAKMEAAGIPEPIIGAIQVHFDEGRQTRIEIAEGS